MIVVIGSLTPRVTFSHPPSFSVEVGESHVKYAKLITQCILLPTVLLNRVKCYILSLANTTPCSDLIAVIYIIILTLLLSLHSCSFRAPARELHPEFFLKTVFLCTCSLAAPRTHLYDFNGCFFCIHGIAKVAIFTLSCGLFFPTLRGSVGVAILYFFHDNLDVSRLLSMTVKRSWT